MPETGHSKLEVAGALATMIGVVVISGAMLDHWVDEMVSCVFDRVDGAKQICQQRPFNTKDEAEFLRQSFSKLAPLHLYKVEAIGLLDKLEPVVQLRQNIAHGLIRNPDFNAGILEFRCVVQGDERQRVRRFAVTADELSRQGDQIKALIRPFMNLSHRLVEEFDPDHKVEKFH
jgi:hypothetical protein